MTRIDETTIADAILAAPGWARVGITAPTPILRQDAAHELARAVLQSTEPCDEGERAGQGRLPL